MSVDDINLSRGGSRLRKSGAKRGFELLDGDFELGLGEQTLELAEHQRVRREDADR